MRAFIGPETFSDWTELEVWCSVPLSEACDSHSAAISTAAPMVASYGQAIAECAITSLAHGKDPLTGALGF